MVNMKTFKLFSIVAFASLATGCQNTLPERSLVFFTGTTLGLEVSASPSSPEGPAKIVMGYKRVEGVLNPVYNSNGVYTILNSADTYGSGSGSNTPTLSNPPQKVSRYLPQAYSVIAKINGEADAGAGSSNGKIAVGQWFATGKAAETLAVQPGIAGAVSGSAEIANAAATAQAHFAVKLTGISAADAQAALLAAYHSLKDLTSDTAAQKVVTDLDALAGSLIPASYSIYSFAPAAGATPATLTVYNKTKPTTVTFEDLIAYKESLSASAKDINRATSGGAFTLHWDPSGGAVPADVAGVMKSDAHGTLLMQTATEQNTSVGTITTNLQTGTAVTGLFQYFVKIVTQ
jgi:hypothetical protein